MCARVCVQPAPPSSAGHNVTPHDIYINQINSFYLTGDGVSSPTTQTGEYVPALVCFAHVFVLIEIC